MNQKKYVFLFAIILLGFFLRIYAVTRVPNSVSADEAAFAYNAYSLMKTGKDEFGSVWPLYFRSFDDYKNPVFGYILIPFIAALGLSDRVIRLPSVLAGTAVVAVCFILTHQLTKNRKTALLVALLAAICPWLIQYSRVAIEMELAVLFLLLAMSSFFAGDRKPFFYVISAAFFGLSFYTYHASKLFGLIFGSLMFLFYGTRTPYRFVGWGLFILMTVPYFYLLKTGNIGLRPYAISVFADQEAILSEVKNMQSDLYSGNQFARLIHNRRLARLNQAMNGYLKMFSPLILFAPGEYNQIPTTRLLFLWLLPLILIGMVKNPLRRNYQWLLWLWLLLGLIPGGLTVLPPYDRRILVVSYPLLLWSVLGMNQLFHFFRNSLILRLLPVGFALLILTSLSFYLDNYFVHGKNAVVNLWGNGMAELVAQVTTEKTRYQQVVVSVTLNQPLIFFLYYEHYSPRKYLFDGGTINGGYLDERNHFEGYAFKFIKKEDLRPQTLYVWSAAESQPCLTTLQTTYFSNQQPHAHLGIFNPDLPDCKNLTASPGHNFQ